MKLALNGIYVRLCKSPRLGLSRPYDWSSPIINDDVLIQRVLCKYEFEDVARICIHFGWERVAGQAADILFDNPVAFIVERQLRNIKTAMLEEGVFDCSPDSDNCVQ
jgi:hypothetical protein